MSIALTPVLTIYLMGFQPVPSELIYGSGLGNRKEDLKNGKKRGSLRNSTIPLQRHWGFKGTETLNSPRSLGTKLDVS